MSGETSFIPQVVSAMLLPGLILMSTAGCGGSKQTSEPDESRTEQNQRAPQDACRSRLDGAVRRLRPDSLSAMTRLGPAVGALNAWLVECSTDELAALEISDGNLKFLGTTAQRVASAPRYNARDAVYIRDSMTMAKLAQSIVERADAAGYGSDTERLVRIFRWVGNNISLEPGDSVDVSRGFLDTLLTGRGSVHSRVWVLAALMRQLQRDVVMLLPGSAEGGIEEADELLIAVCMEERILLFDPQSWLPVPAEGDDSILIDRAAGADYLKAQERWQQPNIWMIAETSAVCPRLLVLQEQLPAEAAAMLYEELAGGTSEIRPLVERVVDSAPDVFDASRIAWWEWPDEQVTAAAAPDEQQRRVYDAVMRPFEAPFERKALELETDFTELLSQPELSQEVRDNLWAQRWQMEYEKMRELQESGNAEKLFGRPSGRLLKTRLNQVEGGYGRSIIQQLQKIRNACIDDALTFTVPRSIDPTGIKSFPTPEAIQSVNSRATGSALYWIGICQMDRAQPGTAITSFASYRRQYPDGDWFYPSLMNQAMAELAQGRREAAAETLATADQQENPERPRATTLLKRLQAAMAADVLPTTESEPETTQEEAAPDSSSESGEESEEPAEADNSAS